MHPVQNAPVRSRTHRCFLGSWSGDFQLAGEGLGGASAGQGSLEGGMRGSGGGGRQSVLQTFLRGRRRTIPWCWNWKWLVSSAASQSTPWVSSSRAAHCEDATFAAVGGREGGGSAASRTGTDSSGGSFWIESWDGVRRSIPQRSGLRTVGESGKNSWGCASGKIKLGTQWH